MNDLVSLTELIIKGLVVDSESVSVKEFESDDENVTLIQVLVDSSEIGRVIGKGGKTANSIRNLVQASSSLHENKKVKINIDTF